MKTGLRLNLSMAEQEEIFDRYNSTRKVMDGIAELFCTLKQLGIRTAVISNNAMSGESLQLAIKHRIPEADMEFCLTSADLLLPKPDKTLFQCAAAFSGVSPEECWYCGDSIVPDVYGSSSCGMTPVLLDRKTSVPIEFRSDTECGKYLTVNNWNELKKYIGNI
jgi:putative hydrolase of the HAD superfamily